MIAGRSPIRPRTGKHLAFGAILNIVIGLVVVVSLILPGQIIYDLATGLGSSTGAGAGDVSTDPGSTTLPGGGETEGDPGDGETEGDPGDGETGDERSPVPAPVKPGYSEADWVAFRAGPEYLGDLRVPIESAHFYQNFSESFQWSDEAWGLLQQNGFVTLPSPAEAEIEDMFQYYWMSDLPVFITTDTLLHVYHLLFDQMLQEIETWNLLPMVREMSIGLLEAAVALRVTLPESLQDVAADMVIFFTVPNVLLDTGAVIPGDVAEDVDETVELIMAADAPGPGQDWTQYKPRGHYDRSEALKTYFRTMMWYGRASFEVTDEEQVIPAALISAVLANSPEGLAAWNTIYNVTSRLIGESDSLNHRDVQRGFMDVFGDFDVAALEDPVKVQLLTEEFATDDYYRQRILSQIIYMPPSHTGLSQMVEFPKIFQFMGQRYVIDSEVFQNVMFDRVPIYQGQRRGLPSGLDVAATFGSSRAVALLEDELARYGYEIQLQEQWAVVGSQPAEFWDRTAYTRHLGALQDVLRPVPPTGPEFMRTRAWSTEKINTALGSWAELRHDTILYAKQAYSIGIGCSTPEGWVEPYPDFFSSMASLAEFDAEVLEIEFPEETRTVRAWAVERYIEVFRGFAEINSRLAEIAQLELDDQELGAEDVLFIRSIFADSQRDGYSGVIVKFGWLPEILRQAGISETARDARIIADVATDPGDETRGTPPRVLHVGLGTFEHLVVAYQQPDGDWHLAVGPSYGYHEFALTGFTRLNDEEWRAQLDQGTAPAPPGWTQEYSARD